MPFYVSLAKINSNRLTRKTSITTLLSIFSKNFYDFLPDTSDYNIQKATLFNFITNEKVDANFDELTNE